MAVFLSAIGIVLMLVGGYEGYEAIMMQVTVSGTGSGLALDTGPDAVANLQLMEMQIGTLMLAGISFVSGCVLLAGGCVVGEIRNHGDRLLREPVSAPSA